MSVKLVKNDPLVLGENKFSSRLLVGTGKYESLELMKQCHEASETEMVTIALRRVPLNLSSEETGDILNYIDTDKITLLPNTAGAHSAEEALRFAKIANGMGLNYLKLEVMGDITTLLPDPIETLRAVQLIKKEIKNENLFLMVYTNDDPVLAGKLLREGADAIMPAGSPIGSGRGIENPANFQMIMEVVNGKVPVILDAGVGRPSDAVRAMELGLDAVLLNTAIAQASDPLNMSHAFRHAWIAGRLSYLSGIIPAKLHGTASSPPIEY